MDDTRKFTLVVAAAVVAVSVLVWARRPQPASIQDCEPLDGEQAIVVRRDARAGSPYAYVQLVDRSGIRWEREIAGVTVTPDPSLRSSRIVSTEDAVFVRSRADGRGPVLDGFRVADGAPFAQVTPMAGDLVNLSLVATDDRVLAFFGTELSSPKDDFVRIVALDGRTGRERWRSDVRDITGSPGPAWIRGRSLVMFTGNALVVLDTKTGRTRTRVKADDAPCVTAAHAWFTAGGDLHGLALDDLVLHTLPRTLDAPLQLGGTCAMHDGALWLVASDRYGQVRGDDGKVAAFALSWMLAIDPKDGGLLGQFELGRVRVGSPDDERGNRATPDDVPFSGDAPRFVPFVVNEAKQPPRLVMVDLDDRMIAWQTAPSDRFTHVGLRRSGTKHYLVDGATQLLAVLDGETGRLTGAATLPKRQAPKPRGGRVWLHDDWNVATVEDATLTPAWSSGPVTVLDARADAERLLAHAAVKAEAETEPADQGSR